MGFQKLSSFNKALVAKQCWRLIHHPTSLAARVLKVIYYPNCSFLEINVCSSPSPIWRGFIWGRSLIEQGSRWRIEGGLTVRIYGDRWIPVPWTFKVASAATLNENSIVSSLKTTSGAWNEVLIRASFSDLESEAILSLSQAPDLSPDTLYWHDDKLGIYTVKSEYKIATYGNSLASSSNPDLLSS
ncbi:hypothetical protein ACOSP7_020892 [Xanthoceras sorbifolium]